MLSNAAATFAFGQSDSFSTNSPDMALNTLSAASSMAGQNGNTLTMQFSNGIWLFTWN